MSGIKLTSDTLIGTPAGGNIEYNGQFFGTDSNNSRAQLERLVLGTAKTATGTSVDFTGIPTWVKRITIMFSGVSTNGTSLKQIQLGDSGGFETTGYLSTALSYSSVAVAAQNFTTGFGIRSGAAADLLNGSIIISLLNPATNTWTCQGLLSDSASVAGMVSSGSKPLSATLDRIRITTVNGTDTFDAGTINIIYEG